MFCIVASGQHYCYFYLTKEFKDNRRHRISNMPRNCKSFILVYQWIGKLKKNIIITRREKKVYLLKRYIKKIIAYFCWYRYICSSLLVIGSSPFVWLFTNVTLGVLTLSSRDFSSLHTSVGISGGCEIKMWHKKYILSWLNALKFLLSKMFVCVKFGLKLYL